MSTGIISSLNDSKMCIIDKKQKNNINNSPSFLILPKVLGRAFPLTVFLQNANIEDHTIFPQSYPFYEYERYFAAMKPTYVLYSSVFPITSL